MAKGKGYNYFDSFVEGVEYSCKAAEMLHDTFIQYDAATLQERMVEIHKIEHAADIAKHDMMERLAKEFITPIEREDIMDLSNAIDDLTDSIEDVLMRAYMFNITSLRDEALEFSQVIINCCSELKKIVKEFSNFKKSHSLKDLIISINRLEEEGDKIYADGMRNLYVSCPDPVQVLAWTQMFDRLEKCCDNCEDVADAVESIIMKNT